MNTKFENWFFDSSALHSALNDHAKVSASAEVLVNNARQAGWLVSVSSTDAALTSRTVSCDVAISSHPTNVSALKCIIVSYRNRISGERVLSLRVATEESMLKAVFPEGSVAEHLRMSFVNGAWVAHSTTSVTHKTGDPAGVHAEVLPKLFEAYRNQYNMLAFRRKVRTQGLWCVRAFQAKKPIVWYFVCPSIPTIAETSIYFESSFVFLDNGKAFAMKPRVFEFDKFSNIELVEVGTSDFDCHQAAAIALQLDFDHADLQY